MAGRDLRFSRKLSAWRQGPASNERAQFSQWIFFFAHFQCFLLSFSIPSLFLKSFLASRTQFFEKTDCQQEKNIEGHLKNDLRLMRFFNSFSLSLNEFSFIFQSTQCFSMDILISDKFSMPAY